MRIITLFCCLSIPLAPALAQSPAALPSPAAPSPTPKIAPNATLAPEELADFDKQPEKVQAILREALALTKLNLTYKYGSSDPASGGMDCSGTMYYLLSKAGFKEPPRTASAQYVWVRKTNQFIPVISRKETSFELDALKPGDLLFWTGTYSVDRDPPVTHSMIYLGKEKKSGKRVMAGASDGRSYDGIKRWGVSVFDFKMGGVRADGTPGSLFVGYAPIPFETSDSPRE